MKRSGRATATSKTRAMNASTSSSETVSARSRSGRAARCAETLVPEEAKKVREDGVRSAGWYWRSSWPKRAASRETDGRI